MKLSLPQSRGSDKKLHGDEEIVDKIIFLSGAPLINGRYPDGGLAVLERDHEVVRIDRTPRQVSVIARLEGPIAEPGWDIDDIGLEELVLAYLGRIDPMNEKVAS